MSGVSPLYAMMVAWGAITTVFVALLIYRTLISMKEDDQLFLSAGEARLEAEQREVITRLERITPYTKGFGFASVGLLVIMAVYVGYTQFQG
jgi:hypothetical protein